MDEMQASPATHGTEGVALPPPPSKNRRRGAAVGLVASGLVAGAILGGMGLAGAATGSSTASSSSSAATAQTAPARVDPAKVSHGPGESLLTGTAAAKAKAAALAAVPGATIIRVETDSQGAAYEAHMKKADGSYVTVKMDANFKATSTVSGFGGPPPNGSGAPSA